MTVLVIGGAASGKSAYAEQLLFHLAGDAPRYYIATMEPSDAESVGRIERHRAMRAGKGFITLECFTGLESLQVPRGSAVLLECLGNLCANELYSLSGSGDGAEEAITRGIARLRARCRQIVIVSNEVFCGGTEYAGDTPRYLRLLGRLNLRTAAVADGVCEIVCGTPVWYRGGEPDV